ncbi:MAG: CocE/NonD family hydrolase [Nevskiaceae bacterium]|nr:MAG: CocE/NonD family hydrolase [Nevskiaceae bacterium]TAM25772.1 MAG: CocE/NonD family hydrolase [Nevskiaceae bacterium]
MNLPQAACAALSVALATMLSLLVACGGAGDGGDPSSGIGNETGAKQAWFNYQRADEAPGTVSQTGLKITLRDGVQLSASVALPADANGEALPGPFPVILTQTGYNKSIPAIPASNAFLVRHGYAHLSVDVRGTGMSGGTWEAFGENEQGDYLEVIDWAAKQSWSNGQVGTWGASFMAITQLFTAAHQHPAHKAVFAIVPMGDAYRDIVFSGGQVNIGFIPLWMGLVTGLGLLPVEPDPQLPLVLAEHLLGALTQFQVPVIAQAAVGSGGQNYDSDFWRIRSPLEYTDRIRVPTFVVGGLNDIFQRGEPLLYEALKGHTTSKLLIGPWQHVGGSMGEGLPRDNVPDLDSIALMWFDRYLKGMGNQAESVPNVTQYLWGEERYSTAADWPHPQARPERWYLRGDQSLSKTGPAADEASRVALQQPVNGLCSTSTSQWTAGLLGATQLPCFSDNRLNEALLELSYTSEPMAEDYYFNGPIQADLWVSSTGTDAGVLVRVTEVTADGVSHERSNGILTASFRATDEARSRKLAGQMIQPWHAYTEASRQPLVAGEPTLLPIEVFPTSVVIKKGNRLRITVSGSDFPHGLPPVTDLVDQALGLITFYSDAAHPSSVLLPAVPVGAITSP